MRKRRQKKKEPFSYAFLKIHFFQSSKNNIAQVKPLSSRGLNLLLTREKFSLKALLELEIQACKVCCTVSIQP